MPQWTMPDTVSALLFDKDGTLVDYEATWGPINRSAVSLAAQGDVNLERRLLTACGVDPDSGRTIADSLFASGNTAEIATCMVETGARYAVETLTIELDRLFTRAVADAVPVTDTGALFSDLRSRGFALGIASSDSEAGIRATIAALGVTSLVDFVAGYDSGHGSKPEPGMIFGFCTALGCAPGQVAMVGDNRHDMVMGRAAKVAATIGVLTGTGTRDSLAGVADICLTSISELPALVTVSSTSHHQ